jgi:hypothetical protein
MLHLANKWNFDVHGVQLLHFYCTQMYCWRSEGSLFWTDLVERSPICSGRYILLFWRWRSQVHLKCCFYLCAWCYNTHVCNTSNYCHKNNKSNNLNKTSLLSTCCYLPYLRRYTQIKWQLKSYVVHFSATRRCGFHFRNGCTFYIT